MAVKKKLTVAQELLKMKEEMEELRAQLAWQQQQIYDLRYKKSLKGH